VCHTLSLKVYYVISSRTSWSTFPALFHPKRSHSGLILASGANLKCLSDFEVEGDDTDAVQPVAEPVPGQQGVQALLALLLPRSLGHRVVAGAAARGRLHAPHRGASAGAPRRLDSLPNRAKRALLGSAPRDSVQFAFQGRQTLHCCKPNTKQRHRDQNIGFENILLFEQKD